MAAAHSAPDSPGARPGTLRRGRDGAWYVARADRTWAPAMKDHGAPTLSATVSPLVWYAHEFRYARDPGEVLRLDHALDIVQYVFVAAGDGMVHRVRDVSWDGRMYHVEIVCATSADRAWEQVRAAVECSIVEINAEVELHFMNPTRTGHN